MLIIKWKNSEQNIHFSLTPLTVIFSTLIISLVEVVWFYRFFLYNSGFGFGRNLLCEENLASSQLLLFDSYPWVSFHTLTLTCRPHSVAGSLTGVSR